MKRIRRWLKESPWLNKPTTRKTFLLPYLILGASLVATVTLAFSQASAEDKLQDRDIAVNEYIVKLTAHTGCITRSQSRDDLRAAISALFDFLASLAERLGASDIGTATRGERDKFLESYQAIPIESCGDPPTAPEGITTVPAPVTIPATTTTVPVP